MPHRYLLRCSQAGAGEDESLEQKYNRLKQEVTVSAFPNRVAPQSRSRRQCGPAAARERERRARAALSSVRSRASEDSAATSRRGRRVRASAAPHLVRTASAAWAAARGGAATCPLGSSRRISSLQTRSATAAAGRSARSA